MRTSSDLRPYQHAALAFAKATPRGYLAAKAGAGKTAVGLALIEHLLFDSFEVSRVLVVGPMRVVPQWATEAAGWSFSSNLRFSQYTGTPLQRQAALQATCDVVTVSFEFFPELVRATPLREWPYGLVIFDEASRLRKGGRKGAVGWKAMWAISQKTTSRILLMSGSPRPGTAHELFAPVALLDEGARLGKTLAAFRSDYLEPNKQNRQSGQVYSWKLRRGMEDPLYQRISDLYFAVAPDLGLKHVVIDRLVVLPDKVEQAMRALARDQVMDLDELELVAASQGTVAGKLHQMCGGACFDASGQVVHVHDEKLDELEQVIEEVDGPLIVCYWYSHERERLLARFPHAVDITTAEGLAAAKAGQVELALLHPASAAHGIDGLQFVYSNIVWFSVPMSFELYDQAVARIRRSGQTETVAVYRIIAANGIVDPRAVLRLAEKEAEQDIFYKHLEGKP